MLKRYYAFTAGQPYTYFFSNMETSSTTLTATYACVIKGAPSDTVSFIVNWIASSGGSPIYTIDGTPRADMATFTQVLDSTGSHTFTIVIGFGSGGVGQHLEVNLTITGAVAGRLGTPLIQSEDITT